MKPELGTLLRYYNATGGLGGYLSLTADSKIVLGRPAFFDSSVTCNSDVSISGVLTANKAPAQHQIGNWIVGTFSGCEANAVHIGNTASNMNANNFALKQSLTGKTIINCSEAESISIQHKSYPKMNITASGVQILGNNLRILPDPPGSATATGSSGEISYDSSYFYVCTGTDTWRRVALSSW